MINDFDSDDAASDLPPKGFNRKRLKGFNSPLQEIHLPLIEKAGLQLFIKRDDLIHPHVSGNKWRKLKYNLLQAKAEKHHTLLTFGGAFSNHIAAVAAAGQTENFKIIGIIRGEEMLPHNSTLSFAKSCGMELRFESRSTFREWRSQNWQVDFESKFGRCYVLPEGGTNCLALKGCREIVQEVGQEHSISESDIWCIGVGTGGTVAGIISELAGRGRVIGYSALKGDFQAKDVADLLNRCGHPTFSNWIIESENHFGGFARHKPALIDFINHFKTETGIPLDPIYTGKMFFHLFEDIKKGRFGRGSAIISVHTGGLQGIAGFNHRFGRLIQ